MKNKRRSIIAVIAVIAIMLGIVAGIYVVNKSKEKEQSKIAQSDITNQDKEKSIDTLTDVEKEIAGISSESQKDEESSKEEDNDSDTVDPDFKEVMDDYEDFMNDYVDFMKKYTSSDNPAGLMKDYTEIVSKYADWGKKIDDIDEDSLSKADYDYYIDVTTRVTKKLAEVA